MVKSQSKHKVYVKVTNREKMTIRSQEKSNMHIQPLINDGSLGKKNKEAIILP